MIYIIRDKETYPQTGDHQYVKWNSGMFMPFDIIKGLDTCPPDSNDVNSKKHWWVCPKTVNDRFSIHDIGVFIDLPLPTEFTYIEHAVEYCLTWRQTFLERQIKYKGE